MMQKTIFRRDSISWIAPVFRKAAKISSLENFFQPKNLNLNRQTIAGFIKDNTLEDKVWLCVIL